MRRGIKVSVTLKRVTRKEMKMKKQGRARSVRMADPPAARCPSGTPHSP